MIFEMPNGEVLKCNTDLDRYHGLSRGTTSQRLHRGWSVDECIQNFRHYRVYRFEMPNGEILTKCDEVDKYYGFTSGRTRSRISLGWSERECALNRKDDCTHVFEMPDGSILTQCSDVDKYYGFKIGLTRSRLAQGWTEKRCANNECKRVTKKYKFKMPDGSILFKPIDVDRFHNLVINTTSSRLHRGWSEEECAMNMRSCLYERKAKV